MDENPEADPDDVAVSMEITGTYDDVLSKLASGDDENEALEPLVHDVELVLETLTRMGEGTRSAIANELPDEMTVDYDAEAVVGLLQVLKRYDLVDLEGNTWKPTPEPDE
jgi:hypothetical protein